MEIEKEGKVSDSVILDDIPVHLLPLAADLGGSSTRTLEQKAEGRKRAECFVEEHRGQSVMIFTDGSVNDEYSGVGSCAAIVIPLETFTKVKKRSEVFSVLAHSTEAEVCGIAVALDLAIQFSTRQELD